MTEWRLIKSIPERGRVLVWRDDSLSVDLVYVKDFRHWIGNPDLAYSHWMPLPDPPSKDQASD